MSVNPPSSMPLLSALALVAAASAQDPGDPNDHSPAHRHQPPATAPARDDDGPLRLLDVSFDVLTAVGTSTERDAVLQALQGGGHDPRKRGFTLQNAELILRGAVDPYFTAEVDLIVFLDPIDGETVVELEEAFLTTTSLPAGLQLEAGTFFTGFGRINPLHPHAWHWQDQPVILSRLFGPDGMRGPGVRLAWQPWPERGLTLHVGAQNANGETMASFLADDELYGERPVGGRFFTERDARSFGELAWLGRIEYERDRGHHGFACGATVLFGPNATGGDGDTLIAGVDFGYRWCEDHDGHHAPAVIVEGELAVRRFRAAGQVDVNDPTDPGDDVPVPGDTLHDWGFYLQSLYGFAAGWSAGLRGEYASGSGASYDAGSDTFARAADLFRADRLRLSPLLVYQPSESSRIRLQYNFDDTDALAQHAHSVWLGFEVSIGAHAAHRH